MRCARARHEICITLDIVTGRETECDRSDRSTVSMAKGRRLRGKETSSSAHNSLNWKVGQTNYTFFNTFPMMTARLCGASGTHWMTTWKQDAEKKKRKNASNIEHRTSNSNASDKNNNKKFEIDKINVKIKHRPVCRMRIAYASNPCATARTSRWIRNNFLDRNKIDEISFLCWLFCLPDFDSTFTACWGERKQIDNIYIDIAQRWRVCARRYSRHSHLYWTDRNTIVSDVRPVTMYDDEAMWRGECGAHRER